MDYILNFIQLFFIFVLLLFLLFYTFILFALKRAVNQTKLHPPYFIKLLVSLMPIIIAAAILLIIFLR